jgi:ribose 5-phosphate isomerase B
MKIAIGSDHHGISLKSSIIQNFVEHTFIDVGSHSSDRVDYPDFAHAVCKKINDHVVDLGILLCGTGIGMSIAANRHSNIFAGLCWTAEIARLAKAHDYINVLVLPADFVSIDQAIQIVKVWLVTEPLGDLYAERLKKI